MKLARIIIIVLTIIIGIAGYAVYALNKSQTPESEKPTSSTVNKNCTPAFARGGGLLLHPECSI